MHKLNRRPVVQAVALALALQVASTQAATITVDSSIDDTNGCSLRNAITSANTNAVVGTCAAGSPGADAIDLSTITGQTITLAGTQLPTVTSAITIQGEGVTVDGDNKSRLFAVNGAAADLTIDRMTLSGGSAVEGGGVFARNNATLNLANSTVSGNTASKYGGGVYAGIGATVSLTNSTVSGNLANKGGGVYAIFSATANLTNSTVSGNLATSGGGIRARNNATANLTNSIIANSTGGDCYIYSSMINTHGANLIETPGACSFTGPAPISSDPMLGPLADNGGPTLTHLPLQDSPVIDAGDQNELPGNIQFDQRGTGYLRISGVELDIGAVEVQQIAQVGSDFEVNTADDGFSDGVCSITPGHCNLREAVIAANANADASTITFYNSLLGPMPATITLAGTQLPTVTSAITIQGEGVTVDGDNKSRLFAVNGATADLTIDSMTFSGGSAASGGGVIARDYATLNLTNSTVSGNWARYGGGFFATSNAAVNLTNSTVSGNSADFGGGVFAGVNSTANLINSTVSGNSATKTGGVYTIDNATANLTNSIIANSTGNDCSIYSSMIYTHGANLIETPGTCSFTRPCSHHK